MKAAAWLSVPNTAGTEFPPRSRTTTTTLRFKDETEAGITMKLKRGTFSATFFLVCLAAMELEGVVLEEI